MSNGDGGGRRRAFLGFGLGGLDPVGRLVGRLEGLEPPRARAGIWLPLIVVLLLLGAAGTFFAWLAAVLSPMAFDAPGAEKHALPWAILCGSLALSVLCPVALAAGAVLAWRRRFVTSCAILAFPALVGVLAWTWLQR
jgi:hypothetical protein